MQLLKIISGLGSKLSTLWRSGAASQRLSHKESEALYRTLIESSLDGMILTRNFSILYCNRMFLDLMGYSREEIYRIDPTQILAPEDRDRVLAYHQQRMQGEVQNQNYTAAFVRKDGSRFVAELNATTVHLKGKPTSLITLRDTTQRSQLQHQLELSMQRFRDLSEMLPQTVYELDVTGRLTYINKAGISMFGHRDNGVGHLAYDSIAPEDHPRMRENMKKSMQKDKDYTIGNEYTAVRVDNGRRFPVIVYAAPIVENDHVVGTRGIIINISERKQMEETIRESEQKYKALVDNSQSSILIIRDNRLLFANNTYFQLLGYGKDELMALPAMATIVEDDRWKALQIAERRKARDFATIKESIRMYTKTGDIRECECLATVIEYEGIPASFMTLHDVTETKRMQEALAKSEGRFRELTELLPQAVYELDINNKPTFMNKTGREMFKLGDSTGSGRAAHDFFSPHDRLRMQAALELEARNIKFINGEAQAHPSRPMEYTAYRSDGTSFPVIIYGAPIFENGTVTGSRGIIVDISEQKAIENKLRESEEKYRLLFEAESDAIFMIDAESGQILDVNPAATRTYGYSRQELLAMKNTDISAEPEKTIEATNRRETKVLVRYHKKKDGTILPVELSAGFTVFRGQKIQIVTARDITENKKMQDALRESENKYKLLVESSQDGILMLKADLIKYANQAICQMLGYSLDEILDRSVFEYLEPSYAQAGRAVLERRLAGDDSTINMDFHFRNKHGNMIEAETISSIIDFNGDRVAFYTIHNITERNRMQAELRESEEKYRELADFMPQTLFELDREFRLQYMNKTGMTQFGVTEEEFGLFSPQYFAADDLGKLQQNLSLLLSGSRSQVICEYRAISKAGVVVPILTYSIPIKKEGEIVGVRGIIIDITERIAIENELKAAKHELEILNKNLEVRVQESSRRLAETHTQLINLQKENIQSQFDVLRQQVNPHFLFNSLNVLTSLIKIEPDLAEQFSEHLSKVYRYVLENKDDELVTLSTELRFLDAYIFLLNIRFVDKIKFNINLPDSTLSLKIIPLAMQLLIENAIKHNIMTKSAPLYIDIFIDSTGFLNIINNLQERPSQIVSTGVGLKNIENRYLLLNNTKPIFQKTETHFVAKVPLVE